MSIGIYDMDVATYTLVPFNLEAMKLSSYYKNKREMVILAPEFAPERHQKFIVRKDYNDGNFPKKLAAYPNVEYGGFAFTNGIYKPLPIEIELAKPDTSIYSRMEKAFMNSGDTRRKKIFQNLMTAEHGRISLDGSTIWSDYMRQFRYLPSARNLILHDYDLGAIEGGFEEVKYLLENARTDGWATKVGMKFPIQVSSGKDLLRWSSLNPNSTFYSIQYNGIVDNESWFEYITRCKQRSIYYNLEYYITNGDLSGEEVCGDGLRQILRQVILARSHRVHFSLKCIEDFFTFPEWERVIKLLQFYLNSLSSQNGFRYYRGLPADTVYEFAKSLMDVPYKTFGEEAMTKQEARELFNFVREHNYPLFKDFYELNLNTLQEEKENAWN